MNQPTATEYKHIQLDAKGIPLIGGTTMKVVELVMAHMAYGWGPEELHYQHPYLTMSQIHSAFAYYWEHKEELDADIELREEYVKQAERSAGPSPIAAKLRAMGLLK
ncbi:MAG: DUF433 domain-containing protein [Hormoscilla sp. GM7CHS1pb]|nr:DUF433 domain-containing protein [Hormoscilla sp. GM7CHS1pb]